MSLRLIEIIVSGESAAAINGLPSVEHVLGRWDTELGDGQRMVRILVNSDKAEAMLDDLEGRFSTQPGFRVMLLPVEATLPRPSDSATDKTKNNARLQSRISREEIYNDVTQGANVSRVYLAQVVIATVVAAVGLMRDDNAVIIGAMVIAPLLGPNMSLCLATTLGDTKLAIESLKANTVGLTVALCVSLVVGLLFTYDTDIPSIRSRTNVSGGDILLALASGCAGVLAFTSGAPSALIGVMVAVALLPPFVVFGLLLASGDYVAARGALMLVSTNVICVNLSGVLTFVVQGLRPRTWWEAERAKKGTRIAVLTWLALLLVLAVLIYNGTDV
ncbi:TIGR00341 family protein [Rubripirellula amarantea]|nr:TIGR00341 family protein [Rubripirellula amarantea]